MLKLLMKAFKRLFLILPLFVQVSLFHSPDLRGLTKLALPERVNEVVGLQHMKLYIFDNSIVISGL